jgi:hypothetical protein
MMELFIKEYILSKRLLISGLLISAENENALKSAVY